MSTVQAHYAAAGIETRILDGLRAAGLDPDRPLSPEALAPLDHFHTGGLQSSLELLDLARIEAGDRVLDIGAGLAGCARLIAAAVDCHVDCIEMSADYCAGAKLLNGLTGLDARVAVHEGSALELPFPDGMFAVVWMQNVGMNIEDKRTLYSEISRVLQPGGRFAFQEIAAGSVPTSYFPLPWATEPGDNFLLTGDEMQAELAGCGFAAELFEDISDADFSANVKNATPAGAGELGLAVYVDNLGEKAGNARRSMDENQVRLVRGVFVTPP